MLKQKSANRIVYNLSFFGLQHFSQHFSHPFFNEKTIQQGFFTRSMKTHEDILMVLIQLGFRAILIKNIGSVLLVVWAASKQVILTLFCAYSRTFFWLALARFIWYTLNKQPKLISCIYLYQLYVVVYNCI